MGVVLGNGMRDIGASVRALMTPELRRVTGTLLFIWVSAFGLECKMPCNCECMQLLASVQLHLFTTTWSCC